MPESTISITVAGKFKSVLVSWGKNPIDSRLISSPNVIFPESGLMRPSIALIRVLLPEL